MANAVVTIRLMPESPDINLDDVQAKIQEKILSFTGASDDCRFEKKPVAFGLEALEVMFLMDEDIGSTDKLEEDLATVDGVQSVDVTDVRRALG